MRFKPRCPLPLFAALLLFAPSLGAQQVTGRIIDQQAGQPLAAVQISISGTGIGALSQQTGRYLLLNVPVGTHAVTAQRIGYKTVTAQVTVTAGSTVVQDFTLSEEALGLDEIIVTGTPGGTQRRAIGNTVLSVKAADVTREVAVTSMQDLLGGRTPGLQFTRASGNVGQGSGIEIRGTGSFNLRTDPIIFVDGVRVNNDSQAGPIVSDGSSVNVLDDFNAQDIESIEVIKGPAAATLYGTEASAGVIQIITKRGSQGAAQFDASVRYGTNYMKDPSGRLGTKWSCSTKPSPPCTAETGGLFSYDAYEEANLLIHQGYFPEWPTKNLYQNGVSESLNLSVRGGTQAIRYYLSTNYDYDEGTEWFNHDRSFGLRGNVSVVFSDNLALDFTTGFVDGYTRFGLPGQGQGGLWDDIVWGSGYCLPRINPGKCERTLGFQEHLPTDVAKLDVSRQSNRFTGGATLTFTPRTWFTSRAVLGLDKGWDENTSLYPLESVLSPVYQETSAGKIILERPRNTNLSVDLSATAKYAVTSAVGTATSVGFQYYVKEDSNFGTTGSGFASPLSRTVNQTPPASSTITYTAVENKSLGFYVQEQLSWNERIFVTGAMRFDNNSAFGDSRPAQIYPKLAATWTVSDESFWGVDLINSFRVRGAWGQAGRQPDTFARVTRYGVTSGPQGTTMLNPLGPGNDDVGPETSTELEVGFDVSILEDRISGEFSWFSKQNKDALLNVAEEPSKGSAGNFQRNLGQIDDWGWEAVLHTRVYDSRLLNFSVDFTGSHVDNEIKTLGDYPGNTNIRVGWQYPNYVTRYWILDAKFDPTGPISNAWGQKISANCDSGVKLGDTGQYGINRGGAPVNCQTKNADNLFVGPAFYTYRFSVSPTINLLNNAVSLHVLADGAYGKWNSCGTCEYGHRYDNSLVSRTEDDPFFIAGDRYGTRQVWSFFDASFWKLREIGARYNLPESLVSRLGADRASLSLSGRELGVIWARQPQVFGVEMNDPEMSNTVPGGANYRLTPALTRLHAELRVTF